MPELIFGLVMIVVPLLAAGVAKALWTRNRRRISGGRFGYAAATPRYGAPVIGGTEFRRKVLLKSAGPVNT